MVRLSVSTRDTSRFKSPNSPSIRPSTACRISRMVIGSMKFSSRPNFRSVPAGAARGRHLPARRAFSEACTMRSHSAL